MSTHCDNCLKPLDEQAYRRRWCDKTCREKSRARVAASIVRGKERMRDVPGYVETVEPDDHPLVTRRDGR